MDPPAPPVRRETQCGCALWAALHYCCCQDVSGSPESMLMPELLRWLLQRREGDGQSVSLEQTGQTSRAHLVGSPEQESRGYCAGGGTVRAEAYSELKVALEQVGRQVGLRRRTMAWCVVDVLLMCCSPWGTDSLPSPCSIQRARQILATEQGGASGGAEVGVVSWGEARWRAELSMLFQRSLKRLKDQGLITFSTGASSAAWKESNVSDRAVTHTFLCHVMVDGRWQSSDSPRQKQCQAGVRSTCLGQTQRKALHIFRAESFCMHTTCIDLLFGGGRQLTPRHR